MLRASPITYALGKQSRRHRRPKWGAKQKGRVGADSETDRFWHRWYGKLPCLRRVKIGDTTGTGKTAAGGAMEANASARRTSATSSRGYKGRPDGLRLSVGFILAKRFTLCAFANFVDVLRLAADEGDRSRPIMCGWTVLSDTMSAVPSSSGISVQPNERLGDPTKFDYIVVIGGVMDMSGLGAEYTAYPQKKRAAAVYRWLAFAPVVFLLHRAGLMHGYRCCVSWFHHADFLEQFDGLHPVSDQIFIDDGDRLDLLGRREFGTSRRLSRREACRPSPGEQASTS